MRGVNGYALWWGLVVSGAIGVSITAAYKVWQSLMQDDFLNEVQGDYAPSTYATLSPNEVFLLDDDENNEERDRYLEVLTKTELP